MSNIMDNFDEVSWGSLVSNCLRWDEDPKAVYLAQNMLENTNTKLREMVRDTVMMTVDGLDTLWTTALLGVTGQFENDATATILADCTLMMIAHCVGLSPDTYISLSREYNMLSLWEALDRPEQITPEDVYSERVPPEMRVALLMSFSSPTDWVVVDADEVSAASPVDDIIEKYRADHPDASDEDIETIRRFSGDLKAIVNRIQGGDET